ncbi:MAG: GAF domain-containing protein [PVC group bacterium]|nr:GAF domain-containing protein [PVC group bacterium]
MLDTVKVPEPFEPIFQKAQEHVSAYFKDRKEDPSQGTIEIFNERYILIRAASMSIDFFEAIKKLYNDKEDVQASNIARQILFDLAHMIGRQDAKNFHNKMKVTDPIEKLSVGPIHFAYSGWASVDILPESKPSPDDNFYLIYDHPFSFEADSWKKQQKKSDFPVCIMNAGYSSGWCEESFRIPLVAMEIMCSATGDDTCRFIMAPPSKIEEKIKQYQGVNTKKQGKKINFEIPGFFLRKQLEKSLDWQVDTSNAIANLSKMFLSQVSSDDISYLAAGYAKRFTESPHGYMGYMDVHTGYFVALEKNQVTPPLGEVKKRDELTKECKKLWNWTVKQKQCLLVNDALNDPRCSAVLEEKALVQRFVCVSAVFEENLIGQILVVNSTRHYTQEDLKFLESLAQLYVIAVQRMEAEKQIEQVAASKMLAKFSHDLRSPLGIIREGTSQILEGMLGPTTQEQQEFLNIVIAEVERLTKTIEKVMAEGDKLSDEN